MLLSTGQSFRSNSGKTIKIPGSHTTRTMERLILDQRIKRIGKVIIRKTMQEIMIGEIKRQMIIIFHGDKVVDYFETDSKGGVVL